MSKFNPGDKVVVNGGLIATIESYDESLNLLTYSHGVHGGTNTVYAHISHTDIQPFVVSNAQPELPEDEAEDETE